MENMTNKPFFGTEIIRITAQRKTLYMKIPHVLREKYGLKRGDYVIIHVHADGEVTLVPYQKEIESNG